MNGHALNKLWKEDRKIRLAPRKKRFFQHAISGNLESTESVKILNPAPKPIVRYGEVFYESEGANLGLSKTESHSGHTSGVGSSSTILSSRDDIAFAVS